MTLIIISYVDICIHNFVCLETLVERSIFICHKNTSIGTLKQYHATHFYGLYFIQKKTINNSKFHLCKFTIIYSVFMW